MIGRAANLLSVDFFLGLDNLVGGAGLGLLGFDPWSSALVLGLMTFVLSVVGFLVQAIVLAVLAARGVEV
jgi:putative Mn2+ efflux pump MntP